jgi:uncharacterized CHY-type Zn-finger protein
MYKLKSDKYKSARGGHSRILNVTCAHCDAHISYYQKDGPGMLKRMYLDRIINADTSSRELICGACSHTLGVKFTYDKEQRLAYRLFAGAVQKKVVSASSIGR